ncbi:MAG: TIGR02117 family protein [Saprospiraceae bacterium]|nr:TIGR02117 family protein [Saprospiraceae bacterium]
MLKTGKKYLKRTFLGLMLLIAGYLIIAVVLSVMSTRPKELPCQKDKEVFITTNGVHLDIIVPKDFLDIKIQRDLQIDAEVAYVSFGWGDKGFYLETPTWHDLKLRTAIKALFLRSETVMHVTNYTTKYDHWLVQRVCESQLELLIEYLTHSFTRDGEGEVIEIVDSGYTNHDTFYEATGNYNGIYTCNEWVNEGLKKAKIKTSIWSPFDFGVLYQVKKQ